MPAVPIIGAVAAVAGAGAAVVGTINSASNQKKALKQQQAAMAFQRQQQQLQSLRQRVDVVRQSRAAYANVQQAAENQGVASSSVAAGGQSSIVSQMNSNLSFLDQYGFLSDQASKALGRAMAFENKASMWGSVAGLGLQVFSSAGGIQGIGAAFKGPPPPK
jgi:hypothetical protein